ncbi:MAG: 4Fe-4S binding protein [Bacteroidales bacterium]|nr:4Fe-4S binding protein [Bacteroidales bacterium]
MKEFLIISDKGGTGKTLFVNALFKIFNEEIVYADCTFSRNWHLNEEYLHKTSYYYGKKAVINDFLCLQCGLCDKLCKFRSIDLTYDGNYFINDSCTGCALCMFACPNKAISMVNVIGGNIFVIKKDNIYIVYGTIDYLPHHGIRPIKYIREQAIDIALEKSVKILICEAYQGWNKQIQQLSQFCNYLLVIIEPHYLVFDFLDQIKSFQDTYKTNILLIINKYNLNNELTTHITKKYNLWKTLLLPYSLNDFKDEYNIIKDFMNYYIK